MQSNDILKCSVDFPGSLLTQLRNALLLSPLLCCVPFCNMECRGDSRSHLVTGGDPEEESRSYNTEEGDRSRGL